MSAAVLDPPGDAPVVELTGTVDFKSVPELRKRLLKVVKKRGGDVLRLDFRRVTRMDTSGVAMLVELHQLASSRGSRLALIGLNEQVRRMIQLARLDRLLGVSIGEEAGCQ